MNRILILALMIYFTLECSLQAAELVKVTRVDARDVVQLYFRFDTPPPFTTIDNNRRVDLVFTNSSPAPHLSMFESDDDIVKVLPHAVGNDLIISLFFRYRPQDFTMIRSTDDALVFEALLGNEVSSTYRKLAERLKGVTLVDRIKDNHSNPYLRSPYKNDWMSFFAKYESHLELDLPIQFSSPPFPIIQLLPQVGERYRELLGEATLKLALEQNWLQAADQIMAKIRQSPDGESAKYLALCYAEALARKSGSEGHQRLYELQNQYPDTPLATYANYLRQVLVVIGEDPHLASHELKILDKALDKRAPLSPYLLLSRIEAALATENYPEMNMLLQNDETAIPNDLIDIMRIRQADYWYGIRQYTRAFAAYQLEADGRKLYTQPFSLGGYCDCQYGQKNFAGAAQCYEQLSRLVSDKDRLGLILYRKNMAELHSQEEPSMIDGFAYIETTYADTEGAHRAALKRIDLQLQGDKRYAPQAVKKYMLISEKSSLRPVREEALFKTALLHSLEGKFSLAIQLLHSLLREFQSGDVRSSAQALLIDILPTEIKRLVDSKEYIQALVLAKQNRELFRNNWIDSRFLADIAEAYQKIGIFDEAQKLYLYLIEISGADQKEKFYQPMIQATFDHGNYSLVDDYAAQYVYNYPSGRYSEEILLLRLQALIADERLENARKLLPEPVPQQPAFLSLAASLFFRIDDYQRCLTIMDRLAEMKVALTGLQHFMYAESLFRTGKWQEAREAFRQITTENPRYDQALYRQAQLARKLGNDELALSFLEEIVEKEQKSLWKEFAERELQYMEKIQAM